MQGSYAINTRPFFWDTERTHIALSTALAIAGLALIFLSGCLISSVRFPLSKFYYIHLSLGSVGLILLGVCLYKVSNPPDFWRDWRYCANRKNLFLTQMKTLGFHGAIDNLASSLRKSSRLTFDGFLNVHFKEIQERAFAIYEEEVPAPRDYEQQTTWLDKNCAIFTHFVDLDSRRFELHEGLAVRLFLGRKQLTFREAHAIYGNGLITGHLFKKDGHLHPDIYPWMKEGIKGQVEISSFRVFLEDYFRNIENIPQYEEMFLKLLILGAYEADRKKIQVFFKSEEFALCRKIFPHLPELRKDLLTPECEKLLTQEHVEEATWQQARAGIQVRSFYE